MSTSTTKDLATGLRNLNLDKEEIDAPQPEKTMEDLPPEILTIILEQLTKDESMNYRLVNSQWKDIIGSLIEKKIISGEFPVSPGMKIVSVSRHYEKLHVRISETRFPSGQNPFPFNSVLLSGNSKAADVNERLPIPMKLPRFASRFGGSLTSFSLQDQVIPIKTLGFMLDSMPSLKRLCLVDVKQVNVIIKPDAVLPSAPPLPNLACLEVKTKPRNEGEDEKRNILYVWLVASYADQLVSLSIDTVDLFPPLRKNCEYSFPIGDTDKEFLFGVTWDSAFGKLKELKILRPSRDFLQFSETSSLQRLSITGSFRDGPVDLRNLTHFIGKCGDTLEKLRLDVPWQQLVLNWNDDVLVQEQFAAGVVVPNLKRLEIHYPSFDLHEVTLGKEFTLMFPALEELQLVRFQPSIFDQFINVDGMPVTEATNLGNEIGQANEITALKSRLVSHRQEVLAKMASLTHMLPQVQEMLAFRRPEWGRFGIPTALRELCVRFNDIQRTAREERTPIFNRLAALGEKKDKVVAEQLMERQGFWHNWTNLKIVSVSSGETPNGDVCVIRRMDDA